MGSELLTGAAFSTKGVFLILWLACPDHFCSNLFALCWSSSPSYLDRHHHSNLTGIAGVKQDWLVAERGVVVPSRASIPFFFLYTIFWLCSRGIFFASSSFPHHHASSHPHINTMQYSSRKLGSFEGCRIMLVMQRRAFPSTGFLRSFNQICWDLNLQHHGLFPAVFDTKWNLCAFDDS